MHHTFQEADASKAENVVLKQKLHSKTEALFILSKELTRARAENDEHRDLMLQLQINMGSKHPILKQSVNSNNTSGFSILGGSGDGDIDVSCLPAFRNNAISKHLVGLRADNQRLLHERSRLQLLLLERDEDVKLMRSQLKKSKLLSECREPAAENGAHLGAVSKLEKERHAQEKGRLVSQLESLNSKYSQLKLDVQVCAAATVSNIISRVGILRFFSNDL